MTLGMGMTEKQGGTDVRANMTRAAALPRLNCSLKLDRCLT
jgi:alkylation response protein AidB-like acyl-CoA dehydrogenase